MGVIALIGGNEFRPNCVPLDTELLRHVTHQPPRVLILPTAAAEQGPRVAVNNGVRYFHSLGAEAEGLMALSRADADSHRFASRIRDTDIVYMTGGDPRYLFETLQWTYVWAAMQERYQQGGMIAGSSAGAMVLGAQMRRSQREWVPALGLLPRIAVLPHHEHVSPASVTQIRASLNPQIAIIGIPTGAACMNENGSDEWQVIGSGAVTVYTASTVARYSASQRFTLQ